MYRKKRPIAFYIVLICCITICLGLIGISSKAKKISFGDAGRILQDIYEIQFQEPYGIFADQDQKSQLLKDSIKFRIKEHFPNLTNEKSMKILSYSVGSYNFKDILGLFREIFIYQRYFFQSDIKNPKIIDCGSLVGISILYFKTLFPDSEIVCFEPAPENFKLLKENMAKNNIKNIRLINKAVANFEGKMRFYGDSSTESGIYRQGKENEIEVDATRVSGYIDNEVDLLKIDVEGAENLVFEDLVKENKLKMIKEIIFEYHHHLKKDIDELSHIIKILEDNNFGYQIKQPSRKPWKKMKYDIIIIYAYRK